MTAPQLVAQIQGQGTVSADNLNTYIQNCTNIALLRDFIGLPGMCVFIDGSVTPNDGGAGPFYWNATSTGPDNNSTVIVPQPGVPGAWIRLTISQTSPVNITNIASLRAFDGGASSAIVWLEGYATIADGGEGMFVYNPADTTSADNGGTIIVDAQNHRYYRERQSQAVSVKWFGATGNGVTNDTTACQNADTFARSISNAVTYFPAGTYMVSQLVVYTNSNWLGDGLQATTITSIIGSNTDVIYGNNSNANWGISGSTSTYVDGCTLRFLTINGNWNSGSGNTSGNGIAIWGARLVMEHIYIINTAGNGLRTGYADQAPDLGVNDFKMEGTFYCVHINNTGQHGWWNAGPHDSYATNIIIVDSSQASSGSYDNLLCDVGSQGFQFFNFHGWSTTGTSPPKSSSTVSIVSGTLGIGFSNSEFEGGPTKALINLQGQDCTFNVGCLFFDSGSGASCIFMGGPNCTANTIKGTFSAPGAGQPPCTGIYISDNSGDYVAVNYIDVVMQDQEVANIHFGSKDQGQNKIRILAFNTTSSTFTGSPNVTDDIDLIVNVFSGRSIFNNRNQPGTLSIGTNTTATFTFPFEFKYTPNIQITPTLPTASMTLPIWVSAISTTSVTVMNPNTSASITVDILASASN